MSQTYELLVSGQTTFGQLYGKINNLVEALRSAFSGTSFPTNPREGQFCLRTDQNKLYVYINDNWDEVAVSSTGLGLEIITARGTKSTLDQRLDVSLNEDGTLKSNVSAYQSQWILPSLTFTYVDATTFQVNGDQRDIYTATRRLKINLTSSVAYSEVVSSSYDSEQNKTTITIADAVLTNELVSIEHSIISPIDANGAITKQMLNIKVESDVIKIKEGSNWVSKVEDADTIDGFHASKTPNPNVIVPLNAAGILDLSATYVRSDVYRFRRVDLTNTTNDYMLRVGEEAYISFSDTTSKPLKIATQSETYYECRLVCSNTGGTSGGAETPIYLNPNNTTYNNSFVFAELFRNSDGANSGYKTYSAFRCGWAFVSSVFYITNFVQYKNVKGICDAYGTSPSYPLLIIFSTDWRDTTTSWTSLGTIVFPQDSSGYIIVRRLV